MKRLEIKLKGIMKRVNLEKKASALIFTLFILAGMLIVAMSGAYIILIGITASGLQSQSTKAYFAAESGVEQILYEFRKQGADYGTDKLGTGEPLVEVDMGGDTSYKVYHTYNPNTLHNYTAIGAYINVKRSVEVSF